MADQSDWQRARLIPTSGIAGADEQETRATSALLAVMPAVKEFGNSVSGHFGRSPLQRTGRDSNPEPFDP
jgi:hypothetical protein